MIIGTSGTVVVSWLALDEVMTNSRRTECCPMLRQLFFLPSDRDAAFDVIDTQLTFNTLLGGFIYAAVVEFGDEDVRRPLTSRSSWDPTSLTQNLWASSALCIIGCKIGLVLNLALHSSLSAQPTTVRTRCHWPL